MEVEVVVEGVEATVEAEEDIVEEEVEQEVKKEEQEEQNVEEKEDVEEEEVEAEVEKVGGPVCLMIQHKVPQPPANPADFSSKPLKRMSPPSSATAGRIRVSSSSFI